MKFTGNSRQRGLHKKELIQQFVPTEGLSPAAELRRALIVFKEVMTKSISSQLENQRMLALASYRCEYCHRDLMNELYEIDHINPQAHGGVTVPDTQRGVFS